MFDRLIPAGRLRVIYTSQKLQQVKLAAFPKLFHTAERRKLQDVFQRILVTRIFGRAFQLKVMQNVTAGKDPRDSNYKICLIFVFSQTGFRHEEVRIHWSSLCLWKQKCGAASAEVTECRFNVQHRYKRVLFSGWKRTVFRSQRFPSNWVCYIFQKSSQTIFLIFFPHWPHSSFRISACGSESWFQQRW